VKVALIAPDSMIHWAEKGSMYFILTRVVDNKELRKFFASQKKYKMLDNGVYETGFPLAGDELLQVAREVKADEVVAPDFFQQRQPTFEATKDFIDCCNPKKQGFKVCAVPQAKDPLEFIEAYKQMKELEVDVLAIPIWLQKFYRARPAVVGYLRKKKIWDETKEHHLLGLDGIGELYAYEPGTFRSVDTSLPFSLTYNGVWQSFGDFSGKRVPMDCKPFTKTQELLLAKHIAALLEAASYV